ncbi:MAG: type II secretion system protein [candidate division Zixibacteria bacterium]
MGARESMEMGMLQSLTVTAVYSRPTAMILIPGHNSKSAFTLLEVLAAIVVFSLGTLSVGWIIGSGILAATQTEEIDLALNIAQANMEVLNDMTFADIVSQGDVSAAADPNFSNYSVAININDGANPMRIDVTVSWGVRGGQDSLTLTTQRTNIS